MAIQPTTTNLLSSETATYRQGWCGKRKRSSEDANENLRSDSPESEKPLFSSTTPRRRWIDSLKSAGNRLQSRVSAQAARIRSFWSPQAPVATVSSMPPTPTSFSALPINYVLLLKDADNRREELTKRLRDAEKDRKIFEEGLSLLMRRLGGSFFVKDSQGNSALDYAIRFNDLKALKILTQTDSHKAFDSCKNIHDFFAVLFPPYRDCFPPKWEKYAEKTPKSAELVEFERRVIPRYQKKTTSVTDGPSPSENKNKTPSEPSKQGGFSGKELKELLLANPDKNFIEVLAEIMFKTSSFCFRQAWELANHPQKLTLSESPEEAFIYDGKRYFHKGKGAHYTSKTHSITINKEATWERKTDDLIFETFNALQRSSILDLDARCPEREEFAFCTEWIEINTSIWMEFFHGKKNFTRSLQERKAHWKMVNTPPRLEEGFISHTEQYRIMWDNLLSTKYLEKNPDFLKQRLRELETVSLLAKESTELKIQNGKED